MQRRGATSGIIRFVRYMKALLHLVTGTLIFSLLVVSRPASAQTNGDVSPDHDAGIAWIELQQAATLPPAPATWQTNQPTSQQVNEFQNRRSKLTVAAANQAKNFYTRFPDSTNVIPAEKLECEMLQTAFYTGNNDQLSAWAAATDHLLADTNLSDDDRFDLRVEMVQIKALTRQQAAAGDWPAKYAAGEVEHERQIRQLIKDYPGRDKAYGMLVTFAAESDDGKKSRAIATEILTLPVSPEVKNRAEGILRRLDATGKPLAITFTALDGRKVDLSQVKGKVVLVDFWATWCGPCVHEIPVVKAVYQKFHDRGFEVVGISFDGNKTQLQRFIQKNDLPWPQYFDGQTWKNQFGIAYGIDSIPTMWLVDKKGNLREQNAGQNLGSDVEKLLAE